MGEQISWALFLKIGELRMKLEYYLIPYTKINSKWIKDLNLRSETIKLSEENIGRTLGINQSKILYDPLPRVMELQTKVNKWDLIKFKSFCTTKETISTMKRQPSEWEKTIANETTDKGLISKINWINWINFQAAHTTQYQKNKQPNQKWAKDLNRHFSREDVLLAIKHMKRC